MDVISILASDRRLKRPMRAVDLAYVAVRNGILHGKYNAGMRLTENELARDAGVSRTPIREALRRLHVEGLVHFEPNYGAVVALFSIDDAAEMFELRSVLEAIGARRAAERASPAAIAELRELAEQQILESRQRKGDYLARISQLNDRFHRSIQSAAASPRLERALAGLIDTLLILRTFGQYTRAELIRSADQHLELVHAFEARDPIWAHGVMGAHILAGRATYLRSYRLSNSVENKKY
ncbi:MAG: GntR family transcriptional regulator [Steroidobacteraceae bacterium]